MTTLTIRNVSDETHAELVLRAALSGQSLQDYLAGKLRRDMSKPDMRVLMARIEEGLRETGTNVSIESILAALDAERQ